jgi:Ca-activated chloride channel family protein
MTAPHRGGIVAMALLMAASAGVASTQQVFRGGVRTVPVYATVSDGAGGFATDLVKEDFEVRDNGKLVEITQFTTQAQPLSSVLLIDGSSSMGPVFASVLEAAQSFIVRMLPADRTAIASFADRFQMRQPFTSDRDELLKHLENQFNIRMGLETRLWGSLNEAVLSLTKETGRKVVVLLSDGKHWVGPYGVGGGYSPRDVTSLATSRDVMVYAVGIWTLYEQKREQPSRSIAVLAEQTGGGYFEIVESTDINSTFTRIATELHQQYVLGFTPAVLDGKEHRLEVRVKRPNARVRARQSYLASPD